MKKTIFDSKSYKEFCHFWVDNHPDGSRGQWARMAKYLQISTVSISHIFNGPRDLSLEQAHEMSEYLGLSDLESEYFFLQVQIERAGSYKLKSKFKKDLEIVKTKSQNLKSRLKTDKEFDETAKATFYSNWYYSGIRLTSSIPGQNTIDKISQYLNIPAATVHDVMDFLLKHGLCIQTDKGITMGPTSTHLESNSKFLTQHLLNWRMKGVEKMSFTSPEELYYSGPMALSEDTMREVRKVLVGTIETTVAKVIPSPSETLACLNIDWFRVRK